MTNDEIDKIFPVDDGWSDIDRGDAIGKRQGAKWMRDKLFGNVAKPNACPQLADVRELLSFVDWILTSKIPLCDKRCLMQNIETGFGKVKNNQCDRESCPDLVLKLLLDNVRAHF